MRYGMPTRTKIVPAQFAATASAASESSCAARYQPTNASMKKSDATPEIEKHSVDPEYVVLALPMKSGTGWRRKYSAPRYATRAADRRSIAGAMPERESMTRPRRSSGRRSGYRGGASIVTAGIARPFLNLRRPEGRPSRPKVRAEEVGGARPERHERAEPQESSDVPKCNDPEDEEREPAEDEDRPEPAPARLLPAGLRPRVPVLARVRREDEEGDDRRQEEAHRRHEEQPAEHPEGVRVRVLPPVLRPEEDGPDRGGRQQEEDEGGAREEAAALAVEPLARVVPAEGHRALHRLPIHGAFGQLRETLYREPLSTPPCGSPRRRSTSGASRTRRAR